MFFMLNFKMETLIDIANANTVVTILDRLNIPIGRIA